MPHAESSLESILCVGIFRENEAREERIMDSDPLEKQRGITILAKNTAIQYLETKVCGSPCYPSALLLRMGLPSPYA